MGGGVADPFFLFFKISKQTLSMLLPAEDSVSPPRRESSVSHSNRPPRSRFPMRDRSSKDSYWFIKHLSIISTKFQIFERIPYILCFLPENLAAEHFHRSHFFVAARVGMDGNSSKIHSRFKNISTKFYAFPDGRSHLIWPFLVSTFLQSLIHRTPHLFRSSISSCALISFSSKSSSSSSKSESVGSTLATVVKSDPGITRTTVVASAESSGRGR